MKKVLEPKCNRNEQHRAGHRLDPLIHGIHGLDWIGLGQDFEETLWIGLEWVR